MGRNGLRTKGELYATESLLMALVFLQQKTINLLINSQRISAAKNKAENNIERIEW